MSDDTPDDAAAIAARQQQMFDRWPAENPTRRRELDAEGKNFQAIVDEEMRVEAETLEALRDM